MDSIKAEEKYNLTIVNDPNNAHTVFNSKTQTFHRFESWSEAPDAYHLRLDSNEIITVRKYRHPSNKYYLTQNPSLDKNQ